MPTYVIVNRAPEGYRGSAESLQDWNAWFDGLGAHLADRGNPVFRRAAVGRCTTDTVLGGYTLITADDLDAAVALTAGCPALGYGGGVEVGELTELNRGTGQITDTPA
ncbi:MAG TPA: hypothetical protein VGE11_03565 [Pseudonocardia sp.]